MKGPGGVSFVGLYNDYHLCRSWSLTCKLYNHNLNSRWIIVSTDTIGALQYLPPLWSFDVQWMLICCKCGHGVIEKSGKRRRFADMFKYLVVQSCLFVIFPTECCQASSCNVSTLGNWHCVLRSIKRRLKWSSRKHMTWLKAEHSQLQI